MVVGAGGVRWAGPARRRAEQGGVGYGARASHVGKSLSAIHTYGVHHLPPPGKPRLSGPGSVGSEKKEDPSNITIYIYANKQNYIEGK